MIGLAGYLFSVSEVRTIRWLSLRLRVWLPGEAARPGPCLVSPHVPLPPGFWFLPRHIYHLRGISHMSLLAGITCAIPASISATELVDLLNDLL